MNFWNWIGLPSRDDIRQLRSQTFEAQEALIGLAQRQKEVVKLLDQIQETNQGVLRRLDEAETATYSRVGEVKDQIDVAASAQGRLIAQLDDKIQTDTQSLQAQMSLIRQIAANQDELLKLLVINALGEDIEKFLPNDSYGEMPQ